MYKYWSEIKYFLGVTLATWPNKMFLTHIHPPFSNNSLASNHSKSASVGTVGSSTIEQGTQKESHPPMCPVIGIHTLVPMDPEVAHEPALAPLGHSLWAPGEHHLRQSPTYKGTFVKSRFPKEKLHNAHGNALERVRGGAPPSRRHSSGPREILPVISPAGEHESMSVCTQLLRLCGTLPKGLILPSGYWVTSCMTAVDRLSEGMKKSRILLTVAASSKKPPWGCLICRSPPRPPVLHVPHLHPVAGFLSHSWWWEQSLADG